MAIENCSKCYREFDYNDLQMTAFGEQLCDECWEEYLLTDKGTVEYMIGFAYGQLSPKFFDADFLGHVSTCWKKYCNELTLFKAEIKYIENWAREHELI